MADETRYHLGNCNKISQVSLYETTQRFYLVGSLGDSFHLVKVDRSDPFSINLTEDQHEYSVDEINDVLKTLGAKKICTGVGLLGFARFVQGWYLLVILDKQQVGLVGKNKIFVVEDSTAIPFGALSKVDHDLTSADEARYKRLFFGIDLSSFYFSYSYNLTRTMQHNMCTHSVEPDEKFCWNWYLSIAVREQLSDKWFLPIIQGYVGSSTYVAHFDHSIRLTLISRRSQFYAGTRYLKRGISDAGHVANEVETEQIVEELRPVSEQDRPHFSAFVQVRGSVPIYWAQENTFAIPKPDITIYRSDPFQEAAIQHFQDLFRHYGAPVVVLNLVKHNEKRARETFLLDGFNEVVNSINASLPKELETIYIPWDFSAHSKKEEVAGSLLPIARQSIYQTGFFHTGVLNGRSLQKKEQQHLASDGGDPLIAVWDGVDQESCRGRLQKGVMRSNCVDCLDRTNATQFCTGIAALGEQLYAMGLLAGPVLDFGSHLAGIALTLYEEMGDAIAVQYAGSLLAHRMDSYASKNSSSTKWGVVSKDFITSIRRYYTSTFTDAEKQSSINLFLGRFRPYEQPAYEPLWSLTSDASLHCPPPTPHSRPLWTKKWWEEPLQEFGKLEAAVALVQPKPAPPRKPNVKYADGACPYKMDVSERFVKNYHPTMLTFFDAIFSKPFLEIRRGFQRQAVKPQKDKQEQKKYARSLSSFANWIQGEVTKHLLPRPQGALLRGKEREDAETGKTHVEFNEEFPPTSKTMGQVSDESMEKYEEYVDFPDVHVWKEMFEERIFFESHIATAVDTSLVSHSTNLINQHTFYSGYLMETATFSFEPTEVSKQKYQEYVGENEPLLPPRISDIAEEDYAALFASCSLKWDDDPHKLPIKF